MERYVVSYKSPIFTYFFLLLFSSLTLYCQTADVIIFTYNRPLQLKAYLESFFKHVVGYGKITVIARLEDDFEKTYSEIFNEYPACTLVRQSKQNPRSDFKTLTLKALAESSYFMFAVDDIVITDYIDLSRCIELLEKTSAYGFYFRLGKNITACCMQKLQTGRPELMAIEPDVYRWQFKTGCGDWNYPNSVDMVLMRKSDHYALFEQIDFNTPNNFEAYWSTYADSNNFGLCFEYSKIVNLLINEVQDSWQASPIGKGYSIHELLQLYQKGLKLDISKLYKIRNNDPHVENYEPIFIDSRC